MNFNSLKEYFYTLYNACLLRLLIAMGLFLAIYYMSLSGIVSPYIQEKELIDFLKYAYLALMLITLTIVHLVISRKLKHDAEVAGLGNKLDLYYSVVQIRMKSLLSISFFLAAGLLFTSHEWFSIYFGLIMLWFVMQWPTPRKVAGQLKLKGDERTMVITRGEAFRF